MTIKNKLYIYGCGGHGRSVCDVALHNGYENIVFVDPQAQSNEIMMGYEIMTDQPTSGHLILGIGDNHARAIVYDKLQHDNSVDLISLVSKDAYVGANAKIHAGVFVSRGVHIGPNAVICENSLLNTHCILEHDVQVGKHCHISVNAVVAGKSRLGDFVMVGAGATIIDSIRVTSHVVIGAGAVVVQDIAEPGTYVGVPARKI